MQICELTLKDAREVIKLDKLAFGHNYDLPPITRKEIQGIFKKGFILGIKEKQKLLTNIQILKENPEKWFIFGIATAPEKQDKGLATKLLKETIKTAKKEKVKLVYAMVRSINKASLKLFTKNGFKKIKLLKDYYGKGKDRILFEFTLVKK